jgi:hypothetical protein
MTEPISNETDDLLGVVGVERTHGSRGSSDLACRVYLFETGFLISDDSYARDTISSGHLHCRAFYWTPRSLARSSGFSSLLPLNWGSLTERTASPSTR